MGMVIKLVKQSDNLKQICRQMQPNNWDSINDMSAYDPERLKRMLENPQNLLFLAYDDAKIAGAALCYELPHPSVGEASLYVHELDSHPDYRRQGVATKLMKEVLAVAKQRGLAWVWVAADKPNETANKFYASLDPTDTDPSVTYSYKVH